VLLGAGDEVAILAPASQLRGADLDLLPQAVNLLESWGLRVQLRLAANSHLYLAGTDAERGDQLVAALEDECCRALFCLRGGYGSSRLLDRLLEVRQWPNKAFVGYSDVTTLHTALGHVAPNIVRIHGPNLATRQLLAAGEDAARTRESLRNALFARRPTLVEKVEFLRPGHARGPLVGGCMSMLTSLLGTPHSVITEGAILFLEDAGEAPYRIDRMVTHLRQAGKLEDVSGIVFGEMRGCTDPYNDLRDVLRELFGSAPYPVAFGLHSGHGAVNLSMRLGAIAEMDDRDSLFRLGEAS